MILKEFPDINWLKKAIACQFQGLDIPGQPNHKFLGWPTVILQAKTKETERRDIKGSFSIFMNKHGKSQVCADDRTVQISNDTFVTTNAGQHYNLLVNEPISSETFNIHFGDEFYQEALKTLSHGTEQLIDNTDIRNEAINLKIKSSFRDERFNRLVHMLEKNYESDEKDHLLFELLAHVLTKNSKEIASIQSVEKIKKSTREELVSRVYLAIDYIHENYQRNVDLDELASTAMLSKFHFLRVFKSLFKQTPHQYIKHIRIQKASELLKQTNLPLYLVAQAVGIENGSSLSRMMFQQLGVRPSQLSRQILV